MYRKITFFIFLSIISLTGCMNKSEGYSGEILTWKIHISPEIQWIDSHINQCLNDSSGIQIITSHNLTESSDLDFIFTLNVDALSDHHLYILGTDRLVPVINPQNSTTNLSTDDLMKIYTGEITNWSTIEPKNNLTDDNIKVLTYSEGSYEIQLINDYFDISDFSRTSMNNYVTVPTLNDMKVTISNTENSIGFISKHELDETVKTIEIDNGDGSKQDYPLIVAVKEEPEGKELEFINCLQEMIND